MVLVSALGLAQLAFELAVNSDEQFVFWRWRLVLGLTRLIHVVLKLNPINKITFYSF